jgi:hypothetical protein
MYSFSKREINRKRADFRRNRYPKLSAKLDNYKFDFFVLPQALQPNLVNFSARWTGIPSDGYVLGVSGNIKDEYRKYVAFHEYFEYMELGLDTPGRCLMALEKELSLVPEQYKPDYVPMRAKFFGDLIVYGLMNPSGFSLQDIHEFRQSRSRLEEEIQQLAALPR